MQIIDSHIHIFDIYNGFKIYRPIQKLPFGLISILEFLEFRRPGGQKKESGRFIGDLIFLENCRRTQLCEPEIYLNYFDKNNISKSIIMPIAPNVTTEQVLEVCQRTDRFIPFASVDFNKNDYIEKLHWYMHQGCKGLKIHPVLQFINPQSEKIYNLLEEYQKYQLPVCIHIGSCRAGIVEVESEQFAAPNKIKKVIADFPNINFIFAHLGLQYYDEVIELAQNYNNIFLDTSYQPVSVLKYAENKVGSERIIFGTDFPLLSQKSVIKVINKVFKNKIEKLENVFYRNILKLINK